MHHLAKAAFAVLLPLAASLPAQQRQSLDGTWQVRPEADADGWRDVLVPAAVETALGVGFDGVAIYRRTLPAATTTSRFTRIEFAAVATHAVVSLNGTVLGEHLGGWTPFRVDASAVAKNDGSDVLEVRVDERVGHNTQGFLPIVQPHFGGIWQSVTLCRDDGPVIDRLALTLFGGWRPVTFGNAPAGLDFEVPLVGDAGGATVAIAVVGTTARGSGGKGRLELAAVEPWAPGAPRLYPVVITLSRDGVELDRVERKVGFRDLTADGVRVLWNGEPLQVRGVLHWGYSPPQLAPPTDRAHWERQLRDFQALGFNCLKCCLWVPPRVVYELADELGLLIWQEYPTWHPKLDQAHKQELLAEYGEFFVHDRSHAAVALRSITCETGQSADLDVVKALYDACKAAVPDTLVVDDSSWIGWQRITDFWDEHPYGNNSWLPGRLAHFAQHIREKGEKPLLLGECFAADTWLPLGAWHDQHGDQPRWWRPTCWAAQGPAEAWLTQRFGADTVRSLLPISLDFGLQNRKFQIEQLRLRLPDAGYVVSVARDIPKCRMGLYDEFDRLKWPAPSWSWHRDTMLCLDLPGATRTLCGAAAAAPVRVSHFGRGQLRGTLRITSDQPGGAVVERPCELAPGELSAPFPLPLPTAVSSLTRVRITAELTGSHAARNHWDVWLVPPPAPATPTPVQHVDALTPALLDALEHGARVVLHAGDRRGSLRTEAMWFLKGALFAPAHPLHDRVPRDALLGLAAFDLESGHVLPWHLLRDELDPMLAFWETHDIDDVRFHLLLGEAAVGQGRLVVTTLRLDPGQAIGQHLRRQLDQHLLSGPAPRTALTAATLAALRGRLDERRLELPVWRFRTDADDQGRAASFFAPATDATTAAWRDLRAGAHWEGQAEDLRHYTGIAWYRVDVDVPGPWQDRDARLVLEGVDDSYELWLDGRAIAAAGDATTKQTIWLERQVIELGRSLAPGRHTLVLRVVDHAGAGGLWKPAFLTTGPTDNRSRLLH